MREWIKNVLAATVGGVATSLLSSSPLQEDVRLADRIVAVLPIIAAAAVAGAGAVGLLAVLRWARKHVLRTPKELKFRKLHQRIKKTRDWLPTSPPDAAMITAEMRERYSRMKPEAFARAEPLASELEKLDVHMRLSTRGKWEWQRRFRDLAEHSRTGDLKSARAKFLD